VWIKSLLDQNVLNKNVLGSHHMNHLNDCDKIRSQTSIKTEEGLEGQDQDGYSEHGYAIAITARRTW